MDCGDYICANVSDCTEYFHSYSVNRVLMRDLFAATNREIKSSLRSRSSSSRRDDAVILGVTDSDRFSADTATSSRVAT